MNLYSELEFSVLVMWRFCFLEEREVFEMSVYTILLFLHVSGAIGLFIGLGIQWLGLAALRRVTRVEQARGIIGLVAIADPIGTVCALLTIASGLYMALTVWGIQTGWILVALASIVAFIPPAIGLLIEPRMRAIKTSLQGEADGPLSAALYAHIHDPILGTTLQSMATLLLGIVFLMTNKPTLPGAIVTIVIALFAGLVLSLPLWRKGGGRMKSRKGGLR
jgi:hypothetical protein